MLRLVYFISGHTDLSFEEFSKHYEQAITLSAQNSGTSFVMGDASGADIMAQKLLLKLLGDAEMRRVTVYHIG